jgi:ketosteroid isomerase-like protein
MADDIVFLRPGQPPMRGTSAFAATQGGLSQFSLDATSEIQEIEVFGDAAYCWTKLTVVVTPRNGGTVVKRAGDTLSILKKQAGNWVLFRDANMLTVVP